MSGTWDERQERDILARLEAGDTQGVELLDRGYRERLSTFCYRYVGSWDLAEDVVQELFAKLLECSEPPQRLRPWLLRVARNLSLNALRSRGRRPEHPIDTQAGLVASLTGHMTGLIREERQRRLQQVLRELSQEHAEVLRLRYTEQLSRADIAAVLEIPESTVKSRLFDAVRAVRAQISLT